MEQDVDTGYRTVCSACLSSDRDLFSLDSMPQLLQIFRLLMYDFAGDRMELVPLTCWECLATLRRVHRFKWQVHNAQEHLRVLALSEAQETGDHAYLSQSLSTLVVESKSDYDKVYFDYTSADNHFIAISSADNLKNDHFDLVNSKDNIKLDLEDNILEEIVLDNTSSDMLSHIVVDTSSLVSTSVFTHEVKREPTLPRLTIHVSNMECSKLNQLSESGASRHVLVVNGCYAVHHLLISMRPLTTTNVKDVISQSPAEDFLLIDGLSHDGSRPKSPKPGYITEYMTEAEMMASREELKKKVQYASSVYKCELCIVGFYIQQQVEDHFEAAHREKPGHISCKVCYTYVEEAKLQNHMNQHHMRYACKLCGHREYSVRLMQIHGKTHMDKAKPRALIQIEGTDKEHKKKKPRSNEKPPKPGDLRKLLSKTTIEGYKCLECDMFFKNSRARKTHLDRFHREGLECDHCHKRFVNKTTLATHLRLHEGPLPREECPICHKMVRSIQLKYHIQRHENKNRYECMDCQKVFSHLATYQAHMKYARAHATDQVFKFPCPMCHKGYPSKEAMQDHFNYQHLGKTAHKCPICDKPIASKSNVEKHIARVHRERKEKPRNHICQVCGKPFTDKKSLTQHEAIHSSARPLTCDICNMTFKQKASLYTHKKRVHKVFPVKKQVHYIND